MTKTSERYARRFISLWRRLAGAPAERTGAAAVEFGLFVPILLLMIAGLIDFANYIATRVELEQALRAGGQYALEDFTDTTTITSAVINATKLSPVTVDYDPLTDSWCECPDGTATLCPGNPNFTLCAGGQRPGLFVKIGGSATFDPLFADLPTLSDNMTVSQKLTLRVR